jgi:hypothetical protein
VRTQAKDAARTQTSDLISDAKTRRCRDLLFAGSDCLAATALTARL